MSLKASDEMEYRLDLPDPHSLESGGMTITEMGKYHNRLDEMGRKKTVKKELFADMIESESVDDVYVYFRQFTNRFAHPDRALGIGKATMNQAAFEAFDEFESVEAVEEMRTEFGGSLTRALRENETGTEGNDVDVVSLYERQLEIEQETGDRNLVEMIAKTLTEVASPWVFSQMVGADLACYVGDYMFVEAISMVDESVTADDVRRAWGIQNDGPLVFLDWARDDRELTLDCQPHTMIGEMKAKKTDAGHAAELQESGDWIAQTKYDGARLFIHHAGDEDYRAYMAGNSDVTVYLPELFEEPIASQLPEFPFILDCEVTPYDPETGEVLPFQHILKRTGMDASEMVDAESTGVDARFKLFDVLNWQGNDLTTHPYHERLDILKSAFTPDLVARTGTDMEVVFNKSLEDGHEGVVLKQLDGEFEFNMRSGDWLKWKADPMDADLRVKDAHEGDGRAAGGIGALHLQARYDDGWVDVGAVGTGFTDHDRKRLWKQYQAGELVGKTVQVNFEELQVSDDGSAAALRFPSFDALRPEGTPDSLEHLAELAGVTEELNL